MLHYTATLFDTVNQWHYDVSIEASNLEEARMIAVRDYTDRTNKLKRLTRS